MKRDLQVKFSSKQNMEKETKTNIVILQGPFVMLILNKGNYSITKCRLNTTSHRSGPT